MEVHEIDLILDLTNHIFKIIKMLRRVIEIPDLPEDSRLAAKELLELIS